MHGEMAYIAWDQQDDWEVEAFGTLLRQKPDGGGLEVELRGAVDQLVRNIGGGETTRGFAQRRARGQDRNLTSRASLCLHADPFGDTVQ